jgi:5-methylcytosine-specific restriction endonuclease McrA
MPETVCTRRCLRCDREVAIEDLARDASKASGRKGICKGCDNARSKRYIAANPRERWSPDAKPCGHCAQGFIPTGPRVLYCSPACKEAARLARARERWARDLEGSRARQNRKQARKAARLRLERRIVRLLAAAERCATWSPTPSLPALMAARREIPPHRCPVCRDAARQCRDCVRRAQRKSPSAALAPRRFVVGLCPTCGDTFTDVVRGLTAPSRYCSQVCAKRDARRNRKHQRRARMRGGDRIGLAALAKRDGWRCHICKRRVSASTWSVDHLVPLSDGGSHTWQNVALAHHRCNSLRSNTGAAQLRLTA